MDTDDGDDPDTKGTVTDYTGCSSGSCSSSTYTDYCEDATHLVEYYPDGSGYGSKDYYCSDFEVAATGDTADDPTTTSSCTGGTGAGCSDGAFTTSSGSSCTEGCVDSGACPGGANCVFKECYAVDSNDGCPGKDTCTSKTYDPDTNSNTCSACLGSGHWNLGGDITTCCGDDNGEYVKTRTCASGVCTSDSNDDACCDANTDCVYSSTCYGDGYVGDVDGDGYKEKCSSGTWEDGEPPTSSIDSPAENSWHKADFDVSVSDSDNGGSGLDTCYYRVWSNEALTKDTTTRTCSSSVTLTVGSTADCRDQGSGMCKIEVWAVDGAGNEGNHVNRSFSIDWTAPTFDSYSVEGCDYDTGTDCWVKGGKTTYHIVRHYDGISTPYRQYLTFTKDGCTPNNCGCSWGQGCPDGTEIKSSVLVDTDSFTDHMWNDSYLDIQPPSCIEAGGCTGNYAQENWTVVAGNNEVDYKIWTFLYDQASNGLGYTYVNKWLKIDVTPPSTSDNTDDNWHGTDQTITLTCTDARSGCAATYYCVYDDGGTPCTPTTQGTSVSVTCPDGSVCKKRIRYYSVDNVGNAESAKDSTYAVKIDKQAPPTPSNVAPSDGVCVGTTDPTLDWSDVQDCSNEGTDCSGLSNYELQVDNNNDFSSPECTASPTSSSYSGCSLTSYVKYYWHARAVDNVNNAGSYSSTWSFTTGDSGCDGTSPGSCPSAGYICTSDCHYYDRDNAQSYCEDSTGCTAYTWMSGASQCCGDDGSSDTFANGTVDETCTYCSSGSPASDDTIDSVTCTTCSSGYEYVDASDTCYYDVQCTSSGWSGSSVSCYDSGDIYDPDSGWIKDEGSWTTTTPTVDGDERCYYLPSGSECDSSGCHTTYQTLSSVCTGVYYYDSTDHYFSCCSGSSCKHYTCNADSDGWDLISDNNPDDSQTECETHCNDEWDTGGTLCCGDETEGWCTTTGVCIYGTQVYYDTRPRVTDISTNLTTVNLGEALGLNCTASVKMNCVGVYSSGTISCDWLGWSDTIAQYSCSFSATSYGTYTVRCFLDPDASDCNSTGDEGFDAGSSCTGCNSDGSSCSSSTYDYIDTSVEVCNDGDGSYGDGSQTCCSHNNGQWNIGGDISNCCGDDSGEYVKTEQGATDGTDSNACCDANTDCVDDDECYAQGSCHDTGSIVSADEYCDAGVWYDNDDSQTYCDACVGSGHWNLGGEVAPTTCCGDDSGEYKRTRACTSGCTSDSADDACCDASSDCVWNGVCYSSGSYVCNGNQVIYCNAGSWEARDNRGDTDGDGRKEGCYNGQWVEVNITSQSPIYVYEGHPSHYKWWPMYIDYTIYYIDASTHENVAQVTSPASNGEADFRVTYCQDDDQFTGCTPATIGNRGTCTDGIVKDYGDLEPSSATTYYDNDYRDCDTGNPSNIRTRNPYDNGNYLRVYYEDMGWPYGKYQICVNYTTSNGLNSDPSCIEVIDEYEDITTSGIGTNYQTGSVISWTGTVTDRYDSGTPQDNYLEERCRIYTWDSWHDPRNDDGPSIVIRRHSTWDNYWGYLGIFFGISSSQPAGDHAMTLTLQFPESCYLRDRDGTGDYSFYHHDCGWYHGVNGADVTVYCSGGTWTTTECTPSPTCTKFVVQGQYGGTLTIEDHVDASGDNYDDIRVYMECPNGIAFGNASDPYTITTSGNSYLWVNQFNYGGTSFSEPLSDSKYTANYDFSGTDNNEYSCSLDTDGFCGRTKVFTEFFDWAETYGGKAVWVWIDQIYLDNMGLSGSSNTLTPSFDVQYCTHDTRDVQVTCELNDDTPDTSGYYCQYTGSPGTGRSCSISNPSCSGGTNTVYCTAQDPTYTNIHEVTMRSYSFTPDDAQQWCDACLGSGHWMSGASQCCGDDGTSDDFVNGTVGETCTYCSQGTPGSDDTIDSVTCTTCSSGYEYADASDTCYYDVQCTSSGWSGSSVSCYDSGDIYDPDSGWIKDEGSWTTTTPTVDGDERCYYLPSGSECDSSGCHTTYQTLSSVCTGVYYYDSTDHYFSCCSGSSCKHYTCNADSDGWDLISDNNPDDSQTECETHCNDEWDTGGTLCCGDETEGWCTTTGVCIYGTQVYYDTRPRLTDMDFPSVITAGETFTLNVTSTVTLNCVGLKSNGTLTCDWLGWSGTIAQYNCSFDENQAYGTYYIRSFLDSTASDCDSTGDEGFDAGSSCTTCGSNGEGCSQFSYDYYQKNIVVKRPNGKPCTYGYECASGLCVDGYCRASCSGYDLKPCSDDAFAYSENKKLCWDPDQDNTLTCEPAIYISDANYPKLYQEGLEVTDYFDVNDTVNYQNVLMAKISSLTGVNTTTMDNDLMKYSSAYDYSSSSSTTQSQSFTVSGIGSHTFWTALFKPYYVVNESGLNNTKSITRTADDLYVTVSTVKKSDNDLIVYFTTNYMTGVNRNVKTECWLNCNPGDADNSNNCPTSSNYCSYTGGPGSASCQMTSPTIQDSNTVYCVANDASFDPLDTDNVIATYSFGKVGTTLYLPSNPESDANNTITVQVHDGYNVNRVDYVSLKISQDGFVFLYDNLSIPNECVQIDANTMNCSVNVTGLECGTYLVNATAHNINEFMDYDSDYMSVEDLSIGIGALNNSLVGVNHVLTIQVQYCLSDDYSGTTVKSYLDNQLLATNITDSSGKVEVGYTNPKTPGVYNLTVFAERGPLKDYKTIWYYVTDSELEMPVTSKVIKAGSTDQNDFEFTLTNPSSESATYQLKVIYSDLPAKFVYSDKDTMEITLNPGDSYTGYIDVIPSTVGSYTFWLQYNSLTTPYDNCTTTSPPAKNCPKMFTADVRAVFTVGLFSYSISPEMNVYSLSLLVLASLIVLWRLKNF